MASLEGRAAGCRTFAVQTFVQVNPHVGCPPDTARAHPCPIVRARGGHKRAATVGAYACASSVDPRPRKRVRDGSENGWAPRLLGRLGGFACADGRLRPRGVSRRSEGTRAPRAVAVPRSRTTTEVIQACRPRPVALSATGISVPILANVSRGAVHRDATRVISA